MRPNVLLIKPPVIVSKTLITGATGTPPTGVAYLASFLRENGIKVDILDAFGEHISQESVYANKHKIYGLTQEQIVDRIPEGVNVIGISCMFSNEWFYVKELICLIRDKFKHAYIVLGGEHPTAQSEYVMEFCDAVDFIVLGEGEVVLYELLVCLFENRGNLEEVNGVVYRKNGGITTNRDAKGPRRTMDLDSLPLPAWDLLPLENYLGRGLATTISAKTKRIMPILASRGCPYSCKFCSNDIMWGRPYVTRDFKQVVGEIKQYKSVYNITGFELQDLTLDSTSKCTTQSSKDLSRCLIA